MAWRWQIANPISKETNGPRVQIDIKYYDDADAANTPTPSKFLHAQSFFFDPAMSNGDMRTMVESEGQRARVAFNRAVVLAGAFAQGTTGLVP